MSEAAELPRARSRSVMFRQMQIFIPNSIPSTTYPTPNPTSWPWKSPQNWQKSLPVSWPFPTTDRNDRQDDERLTSEKEVVVGRNGGAVAVLVVSLLLEGLLQVRGAAVVGVLGKKITDLKVARDEQRNNNDERWHLVTDDDISIRIPINDNICGT